MKSLFAAFALAFLASTLVQWNDPDWLPWVAIYAVSAFECGLAVFGRHERARALVVALVALAWLLELAPQSTDGPWQWNEVQRESGGLLLVVVVMLAVWRSPVVVADRLASSSGIAPGR